MLRVNEIFGPTIQGEGKSVGKKVVFLRLSGCNLHCVWCDTPYTWNWSGTSFKHPDKFDRKEEEHEMQDGEIYNRLMKCGGWEINSVVISGGEPLIQQKALAPFIARLRKLGWWVEVETNGTVLPSDLMIQSVNQFNCSPKLSNSGDPLRLRERPQALRVLAGLGNCYFKFVISNEQDSAEVVAMILGYGMIKERIYLMPEGRTAEELERTRTLTQKLASELGVNFSDRLHITELGGGRGV